MKIIPLALSVFVLASLGMAQGPTKQEKQELATLAKMQKDRDAVKAKFDKHPKDPALKGKFVKINDALANATMTCDALTPHQKYAGALKLYRVSLKTDPRDPEADKWVREIEGIYKSMHRPIPN
ncbi:MAG TPA: hypothetical protein VGL56_19410 [Fimbriimonadaceae bacterium]|jgi:hypothetical protein